MSKKIIITTITLAEEYEDGYETIEEREMTEWDFYKLLIYLRDNDEEVLEDNLDFSWKEGYINYTKEIY